MDDLYDNLDNYNEETTITELQSENKELKFKLEEYASTLEKLQKDFDKLSSEYKKLEQNYSSLLKTAKAEIERKTQIITNLNLEKDKMIIESYHNRNAGLSRRRPYEKPKNDRDTKPERDSKIKVIESSTKTSADTATDRKDQSYPPKDTSTSKTNIDNKLLSIVNTGARKDGPRIERNSNVNENLIQPKKDNDTSKSRAPVRNRRKSMPAVSIQMEKFSTDDDELASTGSFKDLAKEHTDTRHVDRYLRERQGSRISETSSLEDKNSGYREPLSDAQKRRPYIRYDNDKTDRYRTRDKSSHRLKRHSPDRYRRGYKDYHDNPYHRAESDRQRAIASSIADKNRSRRSREPNRYNNERSHHEHERSQREHERQHQSQEKYPVKHKIQHRYEESDNKRMKMEEQYRQSVEEQRLQDERDFLEKKFLVEPFNYVQFSSCESPDYNHPVISTQQIKEIQLIATTKLEDPRVSNKKYIVEKNDGKLAISTAEGRNVDIVPVNKTVWDMDKVSMPKALVQKPSLEIEPAVKEMQMEIENPVAKLSMESREICDLECLVSQNRPQKMDESKVLNTEVKEHVKTVNEPKTVENSSQKHKSYRIPKLKKLVDERKSHKNTKESKKKEIDTDTDTLRKEILENIPTAKNQMSENIIKNTDETEPLINPKKQHETVFIHSNNELPYLGSSDFYDKKIYATAKEVVECDLELSDDNCEPQKNVPKVNVRHSRLEKDKKDKVQSCNIDTIKYSTDTSDMHEVKVKCDKINNISEETNSEKVAVESCKNKVTNDSKKSKNKKKSKHKERETKDLANISEKPTKNKDIEKETKTKQMKSKFSDLFDDTNSDSLIYPEDLGLTAVPASTTMLPDKSVPFIEDAQDAVDLKVIQMKKDFIPSKNSRDEEIKHSIIAETKIDSFSIINQPKTEKNYIMHPALSQEDNEVIYKNLEPGISEKDIVKTVIISTGVQPPISIEGEMQELENKTKPQIKTVVQEVDLQALATSTPHKPWSNVIQVAKLPDTSYNSNVSQMVSVASTTALDISDTNTLDSQTNDTNVPDVRIFVKRRRKFAKK